ncbi:neurofilament medium polypeptide-like, partial [Prorops nasuta]|uniref:neurofilament medium polypeptide-like n=1 Tax=Prorops nasuta TaxID=863751 RepID=UPI0034CFAC66
NQLNVVARAGTLEAAGDIEIDQLRRRLVETEAAMERIVVQMGNISRSVVHSSSSQADSKKDEDEDEFKKNEDSQSPSVKVLGMEMTACCEGGQKCTSRPTTPIFPEKSIQVEREKTPPVPIYLEGALPPQCELLVTDSETQEQKAEEDAEAAVVISSKMTLSLISLDQTAAEAEEKTRQILRESVIRETGQISERTGNITEDEEEEDEVDEDEEVDEEEGEEGEYEEEEYEEEEENKPDGTKTEVIATEEKQIEKDYIEDDEDENIPENLYEKEDYSKNYNINALSTDSSSDDEEL